MRTEHWEGGTLSGLDDDFGLGTRDTDLLIEEERAREERTGRDDCDDMAASFVGEIAFSRRFLRRPPERSIDRSAGVQTTRATSVRVRPLPLALFDDDDNRRDRSLALNYSAMKRVADSSSSISSPKKTATNIHSSYRPGLAPTRPS